MSSYFNPVGTIGLINKKNELCKFFVNQNAVVGTAQLIARIRNFLLLRSKLLYIIKKQSKRKRYYCMEQLTITLPEEIAQQLKDASKKIGVKPEELLITSLQEKLANLDSDFTEAMKYVLKKNAQLYKRLA